MVNAIRYLGSFVFAAFIASASLRANDSSPMAVSGTYSEHCVEASDKTLEGTGLLSLLFPQSELAKMRGIGAVTAVALSQHEDRIEVGAVDERGAVVASGVLLLGKNYTVRGGEVVINMAWHGGDEWGRSEGENENHLIRSSEGRLVVRSEITVTRRGLLGIPTKKRSTFTFQFSSAK